MNKWGLELSSFDRAKATYYSRTFNVDPLIIQILQRRGIEKGHDLSTFFFPTIHDLYDPFLLNDMKKSIQRTIKALKNKETIVIFGDYDADGITSTSILYKLLRFFKGTVYFDIPLRKHGYGITVEAVKRVKEQYQPSLIITVDNGSNAHEALRFAREVGIDVIVTDHHEILNEHPPCYSFVNPKRHDNTYPFDGLSGAGVAFKFAHALFIASCYDWKQHIQEYIELATIGTIADVMELKDENRVIASLGLKKLTHNPSPFFQQLKKQLSLNVLTSEIVGFQIAPIFNSLGRISDANTIVPFLTTETTSEETIRTFIRTNEKRKELTFIQTKKAEELIATNGLSHQDILVICGPFHEGIIGIIASRIVNKFKKPAIILTESGKGSARSYGDFSIVGAINEVKEWVKTFGGHKAAAGLTVPPENITAFASNIQQTYKKQSIHLFSTKFEAEINITEFPTYLIEELKLLEPFGVGNPVPLFFSPNTLVDSVSIFGNADKHAKLFIKQVEALSFGRGEEFAQKRGNISLDLLYSVQSMNRFLIHDFENVLDYPKVDSL